jgi:hypothetical protein
MVIKDMFITYPSKVANPAQEAMTRRRRLVTARARLVSVYEAVKVG